MFFIIILGHHIVIFVAWQPISLVRIVLIHPFKRQYNNMLYLFNFSDVSVSAPLVHAAVVALIRTAGDMV